MLCYKIEFENLSRTHVPNFQRNIFYFHENDALNEKKSYSTFFTYFCEHPRADYSCLSNTELIKFKYGWQIFNFDFYENKEWKKKFYYFIIVFSHRTSYSDQIVPSVTGHPIHFVWRVSDSSHLLLEERTGKKWSVNHLFEK